jgi:hypothetical protein
MPSRGRPVAQAARAAAPRLPGRTMSARREPPRPVQRRQFQSRKRCGEAARLVDAGRQHHDRPLLKTICSSSPRSRIASGTICSLGSQVATILRPTERGLTLRRRSSSTKREAAPPRAGFPALSPARQATHRSQQRLSQKAAVAETPAADPAARDRRQASTCGRTT